MISGPLFLRTRVFTAALLTFSLARVSQAELVPARHKQGSVHSFLALKSAEGKVLALGDAISVTHGSHVTSRLTFHFRDGSVDDETTIFTQDSKFRVLKDHHVQKGPSFPKPMDVTIDALNNEVVWRDEHGDLKTDHLELPPDLANGILPMVMLNLPARQELKVGYVAGTPKPRIVKLAIKPDGEEAFTVMGLSRRALRYNIHMELGGIAGVVAPMIGKAPEDILVWTLGGEVETFLRMQGALYREGPAWTIELVSPAWSQDGNGH